MVARQISFVFLFLFIILLALLFFNRPLISGFSVHGAVISSFQFSSDYSTVQPGEEVLLGVRLFRIGDSMRRDVLVTLFIEGDTSREEIGSQTVALESQASILFSFIFPPTFNKESHTFLVYVTDSNTGQLVSQSSQHVFVKDGLLFTFREHLFFFVAFSLLLIALVFLFTFVLLHLRHKNPRTNVYLGKARVLRRGIRT